MNAYANPVDQFLVQRVMSATDEQVAAILLEGSQRYLGQAMKAIKQKDYRLQARSLSRVSEFIGEMEVRVNREAGTELVENLDKIYGWWSRELLDASGTRDCGRLELVFRQMGEMRASWEALHARKAQSGAGVAFAVGDRVV
jgi:flagellar biosynthetic protein FliS